MLTMNSHGVEISIAGGVEEMVCDQIPRLFVILFLSVVFDLRDKTCLERELKKQKNYKSTQKPPGAREKAINQSPFSLRPTTHQPHQIRNPTQTS